MAILGIRTKTQSPGEYLKPSGRLICRLVTLNRNWMRGCVSAKHNCCALNSYYRTVTLMLRQWHLKCNFCHNPTELPGLCKVFQEWKWPGEQWPISRTLGRAGSEESCRPNRASGWNKRPEIITKIIGRLIGWETSGKLRTVNTKHGTDSVPLFRQCNVACL